MSWDAALIVESGELHAYLGDWNYTHNTSLMIYDAIGGQLADDEHWYERLDGMTGPDGAEWLAVIIDRLAAQPDRFRAMNPENGWGHYDGLLLQLRSMRDAGRKSGSNSRWECSG